MPLPDASFDLARVRARREQLVRPAPLDPGGRAAAADRAAGSSSCTATPLAFICFPDVGDATSELQRPYFGMHRFQWTPDDGVEFQLTYGGWIDVLRGAGFEIERLVELQAPEGATTHEYYDDGDPEWGRNWPAEEIWVARKPTVTGWTSSPGPSPTRVATSRRRCSRAGGASAR